MTNQTTTLSSILALILLAPVLSLAQADDASSRLSPEQNVNIYFSAAAPTPVLLKANDTNRPTLRTNLKRTIRLVDTEIEIADFLKSGISLKDISQAFQASGHAEIKSLNDLYIIKNFANGIKEFKQEAIYKKSMIETDQTYFWYALIPKDVIVNQVLAQREWFVEGTGTHGQLRFQLNSPILLIPQERDTNLEANIVDMSQADWQKRFLMEEHTAHMIPGDLVYSMMALRYNGGPADWSFLTGIGGSFANAYTLSSVAHNVVYLAGENFVEQHALINPRTLGTMTFRSVLNRANEYGEKNIYHLIFNSCITELNSALYSDGNGYPIRDIGAQPSDFNSYTFIENLIPLFQAGEIKSLNAEFDSPATTKNVSPDVLKAMAIIQTPQFDSVVHEITYKLSPLTYNDLLKFQAQFQECQTALQTNHMTLEKNITSDAFISQMQSLGVTMPENIGALNARQYSNVMIRLLQNEQIIKMLKVFVQKL